jgi:hypothetical protein
MLINHVNTLNDITYHVALERGILRLGALLGYVIVLIDDVIVLVRLWQLRGMFFSVCWLQK